MLGGYCLAEFVLRRMLGMEPQSGRIEGDFLVLTVDRKSMKKMKHF